MRFSLLIFITIAVLCSMSYPSLSVRAATLAPQIEEAFDGITDPNFDTIHLGQTALQTFRLINPNAVGAGQDFTGVNFTNQLPPNLQYIPGTLVSTCGSNPIIDNGNTHLDLPSSSGVTLAANSFCTISVRVMALAKSTYSDTTNPINAGNAPAGNQSTANLDVRDPLTEPTITKRFTPSTVSPGGTAAITIVIENPNLSTVPPGIDDFRNVNFTDNWATTIPGMTIGAAGGSIAPAGCVVAPGSFTAAAGTRLITWTNGFIPARGTCTITVPVVAPTGTGALGQWTNTIPGNGMTYDGGGNTTPSEGRLYVTNPPTFTKAFGASTVAPGASTTLTFTITNTNPPPGPAGTMTNIAFNDNLLGTLVIDNPNGLPTPNPCNAFGFTIAAAAGGGSVAVSNGTLAPGQTCTFSVNVTSPVAMPLTTNTTTPLAYRIGGQSLTAPAATANVTFQGTNMISPSIQKAFGSWPPPATPPTINLGDSTLLYIVITNPNNTELRGIHFSDTLTNGLIITNPLTFTNTCNGTLTAVASGTQIALDGGTIPGPAGTTCMITVRVTGTQANAGITNTIPSVGATNGGTNNTGTTGTIIVNGPGPGSAPLTLSKTFAGTKTTPVGTPVDLTFTITNTDAFAQWGIHFRDVLPAGLLVANSQGNLNVCSGSVTFSSSVGGVSRDTIDFANGMLAAPVPPQTSTSCSFTVQVYSPTAGTYHNTTQPISSTNVPNTVCNGPNLQCGDDTLGVTGTGNILPPEVTKDFRDSTNTTTITQMGQNQTPQPLLRFIVHNQNAINLTNVTVTDTLPPNVRTASTTVTSTCGGTSSATATVVTIQIATLPPGDCTLTVPIRGRTTFGTYDNQTGLPTSANGGDGVKSNIAPITNYGPPTVSKAFGGSITAGGTTTLTFTIRNPNPAGLTLTGVHLVDNLPMLGADPLTQMIAQSVVPPDPATCGGGTWTISPDGRALTFDNGTIASGATCTLQATVLAPAAGTYQNTTQPITAAESAQGNASSTVNLTVNSIPAGLFVQKFFSPTTLWINQNSTMRIVITNTVNRPQTGVAFTPVDTFPAGLLASGGSGSFPACNGGTATVNAAVNPPTLALTGGTLAANAGTVQNPSPNASCTIEVPVTSATSNANYSNTVQVTSLQVSTPTTASAGLTFIGPPIVDKTFNPNPIADGQVGTLTFTIQNPNINTSLMGVTLTDKLPAGVIVPPAYLPLPAPSAECQSTSWTYTPPDATGRATLTFDLGIIDAGGGVVCTLTANVTAAPGVYTNTINRGDVTTTTNPPVPNPLLPAPIDRQLIVNGYSIGNRLWYDTNNNGRFDAGETPVAGATVVLLGSDGVTPVTDSGGRPMTAITDANGTYRFDGLRAGTYFVRVDSSNWAAGGPLAGYASSTNNITQNGPTTPDAFDNGIDGANTPVSTGVISTPITVGPNLQPVGEAVPTPNTSGTAVDSTNGLTGDAGDAYDNLTVDFGFYRLTVGDTVWNDNGNNGTVPANVNNGRQDAGEPGIANVVVQLFKGGTLVAQTQTDANGNYLFNQQTDNTGRPTGNPLLPGSDYTIVIPRGQAVLNSFSSSTDLPSTFNPTGNGVNADDNGRGTSSAATADTVSDTFTLDAAGRPNTAGATANNLAVTNNPTLDFGFHSTITNSYSIGNRVWFDDGAGAGTANNGIQDGTELGLDGVRVLLYQADAATGQPTTFVQAATTSGGGYYRFDNVAPGNYVVVVDRNNSPVLNGLIVSNNTYADYATIGDQRNKGAQVPLPLGSVVPNGVPSALITVPPALGQNPPGTVLSEPDVDTTGANPPATHGPTGDAFDILTVDFGFYRPATGNYSIGNRVWLDNGVGGPLGSANNGIQDGNETGLGGVTVNLYAADTTQPENPPTGPILQTTTTDASGYYRFDNVPAGNYVVVVDTTLANSPALNGMTLSGSTFTDLTAISDRQNKGQQVPLPGGSVLPGGIRSGLVAVPQTPPVLTEPDVTATGAGAHTLSGDANDTLTVDFGFYQNPATGYSIGNRVWLDDGVGGGTPNDGIQNGAELGLANVPVRLFLATASGTPQGTALQTVNTDANGYYRFDGVNPGTYVVVVDLPALNAASATKYKVTGVSSVALDTPSDLNNKGAQTLLDTSSPLPGGIVSPPIVVPPAAPVSGEADVPGGTNPATFGGHGPGGDDRDNLTVDFGLVTIQPGTFSIGNRVWLDNGGGTPANVDNGRQDAGEAGIPNVTVYLYAAGAGGAPTGPILQTTHTDNTGYYRFDSVPAGQYVVVVDTASPTLAGLLPSTPVSTDFSSAGDQLNKGNPAIVLPPPITGITSGVIDTANAAATLNEADITAAGAGGHGPLGDASDILTADFGFHADAAQAYSIGNRVWLDNGVGGGTLNDGIQNGTEPGIPNVRVLLFYADSSGAPIGTTPIATTTTSSPNPAVPTDTGGYYRFDGLTPGNYVVIVDKAGSSVLNGFTPSTPASAGDQHHKGLMPPLTQGSPVPGGISGGLVTISATTPLPTGETDILPGGPGDHGPNGDDHDNLTIDFGFVAAPRTYSIGNRIWNDSNGDGQQQGNESGIEGVKVLLFQSDANGQPTTQVGSVTTDNQGFYRFDGLAAGDYVVVVDVLNSTALSGSHLTQTRVTNPNANMTDALNNGLPTPPPNVPGGVMSGRISLGARPSEPIGELVPASNAPGSVFTLNNAPESSDERGNLSIDFGFVLPVAAAASGGGNAGIPQVKRADPVLVKLVEPSLALPGENVVYTITLTNKGDAPEVNAVVSDPVPAVLTVVSADTTQGTATVAGNVVMFNLGTINPGQSVTLHIHARVRPDLKPPVAITNTASIDNLAGSATLYLIKPVLPATGEHPDDPLNIGIGLLLVALVGIAAILLVAARHHALRHN